MKERTSNYRDVLHKIPETDQSKNVSNLSPDRDKLPIERALGLQWCMENDRFNFHIICQERMHMWRGILSVISSICNPIGYLSPITLAKEDMAQ